MTHVVTASEIINLIVDMGLDYYVPEFEEDQSLSEEEVRKLLADTATPISKIIDSLDHLDVVFKVEIAYSVKIPLKEWNAITRDEEGARDAYGHRLLSIDSLVAEINRQRAGR